MIKEDYVSFEVAKLLKDNGFDGECRMKYFEHDKQMSYHVPNPSDIFDFTTNRKKLETLSKKNHCEYCLCPTLQMALKWLRLFHDIIIDVSPNLTLNDVCKGGFMAEVYQYGNIVPDGEFGCNIGDDYTYEQVVEAALLYVLKNLI